MRKDTVIIKKYENRRLYDTANSRYINLDEVARLLQSEHDVKVVDATTNEDITRLILTQIIVEDAKGPNSTFPVAILRDMVIASGRASHDGALKYMKSMMDLYQKSYRAVAPSVSPFDFLRPRAAAAPPPAAGAGSELEGGRDVDELKQRLAELESLVSSLAPAKPAAKRRKTRG